MAATSPHPKTSERGIALIKKWESFFPRAYKDAVKVWTIGWGSITDESLGIFVKEGMVIDRATGERWLRLELAAKEAAIYKLLRVPVTQYQFDALSSFTYNVGVGNLKKSTLLKRLNAGAYDEVPTQLMRWTRAQDRETKEWKTLRGLYNRRMDEARMWNNQPIAELPVGAPVRVPGEVIKPVANENAAKEVAKDPKAQAAGGTALTVLASAINWLKENPEVMLAAFVFAVGLGAYVYKRYKDKKEFLK